MDLELLDILRVAVIICLAGVGQSAVGFGYGLFATPLLVWVGIPLPICITIVATCSVSQATVGAVHLRRVVPWRASIATAALRVISVLIGLLLLKRLVVLDKVRIRFVVGCILCGLVVFQYLCKPHRVKRIHWGWGILASVSSGVLAGVCGMGGPPLVLWAMAHDWSAAKTRGYLFAMFAVSIPIQIVFLSLTFGGVIWRSVGIGLACLPLVYMGAAIGLPLGNRMPKRVLRRVAYLILLVIGLSAVVPGLVAMR